MPIAMNTIVFFISQMAILEASISFEKAVPEEYIHTKHDQQRRSRKDQVGKDLGRKGQK
jgi:hypothetical protein